MVPAIDARLLCQLSVIRFFQTGAVAGLLFLQRRSCAFAGYIVNTDADRSTAALMARVTGEAEAMSEVVAVVVVVFDVVPLGATVVGKAVDVLSLRNVVMSASSDATDTVNTRVWPATTMVAPNSMSSPTTRYPK